MSPGSDSSTPKWLQWYLGQHALERKIVQPIHFHDDEVKHVLG